MVVEIIEIRVICLAQLDGSLYLGWVNDACPKPYFTPPTLQNVKIKHFSGHPYNKGFSLYIRMMLGDYIMDSYTEYSTIMLNHESQKKIQHGCIRDLIFWINVYDLELPKIHIDIILKDLIHKLIQVDIDGYPPIPLAQKQLIQFGSFSTIFRVLNFWGHFEALNDIFLDSQWHR